MPGLLTRDAHVQEFSQWELSVLKAAADKAAQDKSKHKAAADKAARQGSKTKENSSGRLSARGT